MPSLTDFDYDYVGLRSQDDHGAAFTWCSEHLGPHRRHLSPANWRWWTSSQHGDPDHQFQYMFAFRYKADAMLFKLTWG